MLKNQLGLERHGGGSSPGYGPGSFNGPDIRADHDVIAGVRKAVGSAFADRDGCSAAPGAGPEVSEAGGVAFAERSRNLVRVAAGASGHCGNNQQDDAYGDRDVSADVMVALPVEGVAGKERRQ
jgi:hypothetical protein